MSDRTVEFGHCLSFGPLFNGFTISLCFLNIKLDIINLNLLIDGFYLLQLSESETRTKYEVQKRVVFELQDRFKDAENNFLMERD